MGLSVNRERVLAIALTVPQEDKNISDIKTRKPVESEKEIC